MQPKPMQRPDTVEPNVALCYVRQSYTRDEDDMNSPTRQKANIERICERNGWTPEWYEDVGGHKSGTDVKNRPGWLALKNRLGDYDVAALVANDLSRLHRNVSRISSLIETLEESKITLMLAASDITIDTSTLMGQMFAQFSGLMDAYYAKDAAAKAKDSIEYRKRQGKVIGIPPFGTTRDEEGFLIPTPEGAWLMPDGTFQAGLVTDDTPAEDAVWHGYYDCAKQILSIYAEGELGLKKIAYRMSEQGWAYRTRRNKPRPIKRDDIRRVVANWPEYGGIVEGRKGKDRPAYEEYDVDEIRFIEKRAVMPIDLLRTVAQVRQQRTIRPPDNASKRTVYPYLLTGITYCADCEKLAEKHKNPALRSSLSGTKGNGVYRYRHAEGVSCGCKRKTIRCEDLDADFRHLVGLLTIDSVAKNLIVELAIQADKADGNHNAHDLETKKKEAIALCQCKIDAAVHLYGEGRIDRAEYLNRVSENEREISHWQARTTETQKIALELAVCMEAIGNLGLLWDESDDEERRSLVRNLFEYIVVDLDKQQIVDFRLNPWADRFVILRARLYEGGYDDLREEEKKNASNIQGLKRLMPPRGLDDGSFPPSLSRVERIQLLQQNLEFIIWYLQEKLYWKQEVINYTQYDPLGTKEKRNTQIMTLYLDGVSLTTIANQFGLSPQRVHQIVQS